MQNTNPAIDLLHRIAYSLSFGELPRVQLPSRMKQDDHFLLLKKGTGISFYCEDLFEGGRMRTNFRDYLLKTLSPALRVATRSDFNADSVPVQGAAEYFVLSCPDGQQKLFYIGPYPHVLALVPTKQQLEKAGRVEMTSATPSNMSAAELIRLRQTRRPHGDMWA